MYVSLDVGYHNKAEGLSNALRRGVNGIYNIPSGHQWSYKGNWVVDESIQQR